jgi:hypothetical protein
MKHAPPVCRGALVSWVPAVLLALAICAGPLWLWREPLQSYFLKLDDFVYLARSRTAGSLEQHLFVPHNGHVVPLFLVETHLLARLAGSLEVMPRVLSFASYATLLAAMAVAGHIVAWETGKAALGLAAMAATGFSTVLGPALLWYAAGQALAAGVLILVMLAGLQGYRARSSPSLLVAGILAAAAAPFFWTAGYTAGLVGLAYLWADGRRFCRLAAPLPVAGSLFTGLVVWCMAAPGPSASTGLSDRFVEIVTGLPAIGTHISQATCEALVINNLGLDAATAPAQSLVLLGILAGVWFWSRRRARSWSWVRWPRLNPLEAAGVVLILANFALVFAARGPRMTYENLRALGWYQAIPDLGAVLFAAGWWGGAIASPPPRSIEAPRWQGLAGVVLFAALLLVMQAPRAARITFQYDGAASEVIPGAAAGPRNRAQLVERARRQRSALAELDKVERMARSTGETHGKPVDSHRLVEIPGMPAGIKDFDVADLLDVGEPRTSGAREQSPRSAPRGSDHE